MKPPKKAPHKPPKMAVALVPFKRIGDAHAAVCSSGRVDGKMGGIDVSWAGGEEPAILVWLKKMGKLGSVDGRREPHVDSTPSSAPQGSLPQMSQSTPSGDTPFSSFPSTLVRIQSSLSSCDLQTPHFR